MGRRRVGVALTALALLALAWPPLGVEASRALIEGDGARHPRREGPLGAVPSADGWEDQVPESSACLLYTSPSPRDVEESRMPSSA